MRYLLSLFWLLTSWASLMGQVITEQFSLPIDQDTIIETNYGSWLSVTANSFRLPDSVAAKTVVLEVTEIFRGDQMAALGIATESDEGLLISNGMIRLQASIDGKPVDLLPGKAIAVQLLSIDGRTGQAIYRTDTSREFRWERTDVSLTIDTCLSRRREVVYEVRSISKKQFKQQRKRRKELERQNPIPEPMFGGRAINIRFGRRTFTEQIPVDTVWVCLDGAVQYNRFEAARAGWYNVDKLWSASNRHNILVTTELEDYKVFLLFANSRVMARGRVTSGAYKFIQIPADREALLVLSKRAIDGKTIQFITQKVFTGNRRIIVRDEPRQISVKGWARLLNEYYN